MNLQLMLIKQFLKEKKQLLFSLTLLTVTYFVCFITFRIHFFIFLYPTLIFYIFFLIYFYFDYKNFKERYSELEQILSVETNQILELLHYEKLNSMELKELYKVVELLNKELKAIREDTLNQNIKLEEDISTWIHQIKIPITAMKLDLEDEDSQLSRQLKSELFRIELYTEMILNYFRLKSSSTDYVFVKTNVSSVVRNELKRFATEFIKRKITLELNCEDTYITTDEKWLGFIVDQILSNALKYTPSGGKISVNITQNKLTIEDNGIGISSSDIPRIFERGYTGYNGRVDKRASGLGLYLTKQACDNLNIPIKLESELNQGTKVIIDLTEYPIKL